MAERKAGERNAAWIRELEARDEEEREIRARREGRRDRGVKKVVAENVTGNKEGADNTDVDNKVQVEREGEEEDAAGAPKRGVMESVQGLVWGGKK